jgi:hypothetical protein
LPELKVLSSNEFVTDDSPGDGPEAGGVAAVDDLLGGGREEVGDRLGAQDQDPVALGGDGKSPPDLAVYLDSCVGASREALPAADACLIVDSEQQRIVHRHRDGVGGTDANTSQAPDAELGVNYEVQRSVPSGEGKVAI